MTIHEQREAMLRDINQLSQSPNQCIDILTGRIRTLLADIDEREREIKELRTDLEAVNQLGRDLGYGQGELNEGLAQALGKKLDEASRQYAELKAATWNVPGEPPALSHDTMTHEQTRRQAVDQSKAFDDQERLMEENAALEGEEDAHKDTLRKLNEAGAENERLRQLLTETLPAISGRLRTS